MDLASVILKGHDRLICNGIMVYRILLLLLVFIFLYPECLNFFHVFRMVYYRFIPLGFFIESFDVSLVP